MHVVCMSPYAVIPIYNYCMHTLMAYILISKHSSCMPVNHKPFIFNMHVTFMLKGQWNR